MLTEQAKQHISHLHRGGKVGLWCEGKNGPSTWFDVGDYKPLPDGKSNVYYNVNPIREIPPASKKGSTDVSQIRSQIDYLGGINTLYCEIDGKDFVDVPQERVQAMADEIEGFHSDRKEAEREAERKIRDSMFHDDPDHYKSLALEQVKTWTPQPSKVYDSGGGYHCYWYLIEPFLFNGNGDRERADRLQKTWVDHVMPGSDGDAKNLNRILRVPGTYNYKYNPPALVAPVDGFTEQVYTLADLEARALEVKPDALVAPKKRVKRDEPITDRIITATNAMRLLSPSRCSDYGQWVNVGMILKAELGDNVLAFELWREWSAKSGSYNEGDCKDKWDGFKTDGDKLLGLGTLVKWSQEDSGQVDDQARDGDPETLLEAVKSSGGLEQAKAVERLALALVGEGAATVNHFAGILAGDGITTKTAFLADVREARKTGKERAKVERRQAARAFSKERKLTSQVYHSLFGSWGYDIRLNLCNDDVEVGGAILTDQIEADIRQRVRDYAITEDKEASMGAVEDSIRTLAAQRSYHPIKDYFSGLQWDGQDHLGVLLSHFQGDGYFDRWLDTWLPGAVARVYDGWQNPMLVLDGPQGVGKSYLASWLCSPLPKMFVESPISPEYKDHKLRLIQTFIWEVQELGATTRKADQDALKAFITLGAVMERKSYGRRPIQKPVVCSFIGTINNDAGFLTDLTGNRRYLVTTLTGIDWNYSKAVDVNQLWAQAVHVYRARDNWKLDKLDQEKSESQNKRYMVSDPVEVFLELAYEYTGSEQDFVNLAAILDGLKLSHNVNPTRGTAMRVASVLKSWRATKGRGTVGKKQVRGYYGIRYK